MDKGERLAARAKGGIEELGSHLGGRPVLAIDAEVELPHRLVRQTARELFQCVPKAGVPGKRIFPGDYGALIGREVVPVIVQNGYIKDGNQAVGGTGGDEVHFAALQRRVEQPQIHGDGSAGGAQVVSLQQPRQPVGPLGKLVADAQVPALPGGGLGKRGQFSTARGLAPHNHGEGVVKTQRAQPVQMPLALVGVADLGQHGPRIPERLPLEDGGKSGAGVFGVEIDGAAGEGLVGQEGAAQIQLAPDGEAEPALNVLRQDFAQQHLLREILGADHDGRGFARAAAPYKEGQAGDSLRSIHSNTSSASTAMMAAGSAPARTVGVSTIEIPRKMKTPSPPPPMAAAMVAVPMVATVARRRPATTEGAASGSSTCHRICRAVIPMATADSRTDASTPVMPSRVLRRMGSRAYRHSATMAVRLPMPPINGRGTRKPNSARLGMVCAMLATPTAHRRGRGRRESSTPAGSAM